MIGRSAASLMLAAVVLVAGLRTVHTQGAQRPPTPIPSGNRIIAQDGDSVIIEGDARIRIVRRREAQVRVVFNAQERWLVLLADYATATGGPDGRVDMAYHYRDLIGEWPLDARWDSAVTVEEYSVAGEGRGEGLAITTPLGVVQFLRSRAAADPLRDPAAIAVLSSMSGGSSASGMSFDDAERWNLAQVRRSDGVMQIPAGATSSLSMSAGPGAATARGNSVDGTVRVGAVNRTPVKIVDVPPVTPELARRAGVFGTVILEVTIGADGSVERARVLRSIPLLDQAAIDAVKQWRFEPVMLNGQAVPVITTVPVTFTP